MLWLFESYRVIKHGWKIATGYNPRYVQSKPMSNKTGDSAKHYITELLIRFCFSISVGYESTYWSSCVMSRVTEVNCLCPAAVASLQKLHPFAQPLCLGRSRAGSLLSSRWQLRKRCSFIDWAVEHSVARVRHALLALKEQPSLELTGSETKYLHTHHVTQV